MSITDELRKFALNLDLVKAAPAVWKEGFLAIADRIDEKAKDNERFRDEAEPFCDTLREASSEREDVTLFGVDYTALPMDADGVPIRVGDVLDPPAGCDDYVPLQVMRLTYDGYEQEWFFDGEAGGFCGMVGEHMDVAGWTHHKPTVEDVLQNLLEKAVGYSDAHTTVALDAIAEYASKLRLADGGKE